MKRRDQTKLEMTKRNSRHKAKLSEADTEELSNLNYDNDDQVKIINPDLIPNIKKDFHNITLLMFLYLLQGNFISI